MSLLRGEREVALNDLQNASEETIDHYRDAVNLLGESDAGDQLLQIAEEREAIAAKLEHAIRALGDLPQAPDTDKESVQKLIHRVRAALSPDAVKEVLEQRLAAERKLIELAAQTRRTDLDETEAGVVGELAVHAEQAIACLQLLIADAHRR